MIIFPPENANDDVTDCDSGDEELTTINNLPGSQLRNDVELVFDNATELPQDSVNSSLPEEDSDDDNIPLALFLSKEKLPHQLEKRISAHWIQGDLYQHPDCTYWKTQFGPKMTQSPMEIFNLFFDDEVINLVTEYTNIYAGQRNLLNDITQNEIRCFIGVLVLSGYVVVPKRYMYWENRDDSHNAMVVAAISRDRFSHIMKVLHVCNNLSLDKFDRFAKMRPLFDVINKKFIQFSPLEQHHSIDEAMVPYFGRHPTKQFIRGKPIRWGYKMWVGALRLGYIVWFSPYQGNSTTIPEQYKVLGLGASVVLSYADRLNEVWPQRRFHLIFDNYFTSIHLLHELKQRGIFGTGTVRENRTMKCPLPCSSIMKKTERGKYEYRLDKNTGIVVCRWHDNNIVSIASNFVPVMPCFSVKRFSQAEKKHIQVPQPNIVRIYNNFMGGVDRSDQNISLYRVSIRGKKWYFPLFAHCVDMAIQNAWQIHKTQDGKLDQLEFRRSIATNILETFKKETKRGPSKRNSNSVANSRYDGINHLVLYQEKQSRCGYCHKKVQFLCEKCKIPLHPKFCFKSFHSL